MTDITQKCRITEKEFVITEEDQKFYEKMEVPVPILCPEERQRKRAARRNARNFYKRECDATHKPLISIYNSDTTNPVYHYDYWHSDSWDGLEYGKEYDFSKKFWEQFGPLLRNIPVPHMNVLTMENQGHKIRTIILRI